MSREPITHELKCHPEPFKAVKDGSKPFEWRKDDRGYLVWDTLQLREWSPDVKLEGEGEPVGYTGEILHRTVTYIIREGFGIPEGYCIMGLAQAPQSSPAPVICGCGDEIIANSDAECGNCAAIKGMEVDRLRALASPAPSVIEAGDALRNAMAAQGVYDRGEGRDRFAEIGDKLVAAWDAAKASRPSVTAPDQGVTVDQIKAAISEVDDMHPYKVAGNADSYSSYNEGWSDACGIIEDRLSALLTK